MSRPMLQSSPARRPRAAPISRPPLRSTSVVLSTSQACTSASPSFITGMCTPGLACSSCTQHARCRVSSSPASAGHGCPDLGGGGAEVHDPGGVGEVRTSFGGASYGLVASPRGDPRVVAGEQHRRDLVAAPRGGLGVDGVLEQPVLWDSSTSDSALPTKPGSSRTTASITPGRRPRRR